MSNQHVHTFHHAVPRTGQAGQSWFKSLRQNIWDAFEASGSSAASADFELLALARKSQSTHPKLTREIRSYVHGGSTY